MKNLLSTIVFLFVLASSAQTTITKQLGDFTKLKVYNGINLELVKSSEQKIVITGEKAEKVLLKNTNNTLKVALKFPETLAKNNVKVVLYYSKEIDVVDANEGSSIVAKEFNQQQLEVKVQEGALINMVIDVKHLTVKAVTGGIIKLSGLTKNQQIETRNAGVYHGYKLTTTDATIVKASLGGKAEVLTGETLDAKVSFGGSIFYKGTPEVLKTKKVLGGTIEAKN